jgi:hypothetical protein
MAKKQEKLKTDSALKTLGKYSAVVVISWAICCYLVYAFVSSIGIPLLSSPRPAVPFSMASVICLMLWVADGFVGVRLWGLSWYKVVLSIVLSIIVFSVVLIGPSEYKEYQRRQLPKLAAQHAEAVVLHDGMIDAKDDADGDIYIAFLVPFEVTEEISSHELPYLFESVKISEKYRFSNSEVCNQELYSNIKNMNEQIDDKTFFSDFTFLSFPSLEINKSTKIVATISDRVYEHKISTGYPGPDSALLPGKLYYIYDGRYFKSKNCTAKDFINESVTTPFIHVKK